MPCGGSGMKRRARVCVWMAAAALAVVMSPGRIDAQKRQVPAETMAAARRVKGWTPPRTPWGHPDLQGIWTSDDMRSVPVQRPDSVAGRNTLTADEFTRRASGDESS